MGDNMNEITKYTINLLSSLQLEEECNIEISKDNKYIVKINKDNKLRYIGSKYSVEKDIQNFIEGIGKIDNNTILLIFGLGTGEQIQYLLSNLSNTNKVFIVEPSINIIKETLKLNHIKDILMDKRVALCYIDGKIRKHINSFIDDYSINNTKMITFSNYPTIFKNEYEMLINEFNSIKSLKKIGMDTFNTFSDIFFYNFIENVFSLDEFYTVDYLKNMYRNKPAIIVSAGPSLNKNVRLLKHAQDKFIIICGPRTLGILIENDIKPDFICLVDPQEDIVSLMGEHINSGIPLIFMDSGSNQVVKRHKGLKIIAANQGMEKHLEDMLGTKVGSIIQGGSVAHFCMGLAVYLGCSTIIFIGQDLAYTNDKFQAEGTYLENLDEIKHLYENNKEEWDKDKNYNIYVRDIFGDMIRTSIVLNSYREEFEEIISSCNGIEFINSTEGGSDIKGTEVMSLKDSINKYGVEAINKDLEKLLPEPIVIDEDKFIKRVFKIIDKLEIIKKACEEGLKYSEQMLYFYKYNKHCDINKVFSKLDKVDTIINDIENLGFLAYKLVSAINSVLLDENFKEKENETENETGVRLARRSFEIYAAVSNIVGEIIESVRERFIFVQYFQLESKNNCS